jgi:hypothetical protein
MLIKDDQQLVFIQQTELQYCPNQQIALEDQYLPTMQLFQ